MSRKPPTLHRDDPSKEPLVGHVKVTRQDWLNAARDILVTEGVAEVKILTLSARLDVSRSSFYWYFKTRRALLDALIEEWENRNTQVILEHCARPAGSVSEAVLNFHRCFVDPDLFDQGMDFAIREWARRDDALRGRVDAADDARVRAATEIFERFDYDLAEADARGRILYFQQLGYHALDVREPLEVRISRIEPYLIGFTGRPADPEACAAFCDFARRVLS